jgi:hypothetical protein
MEVEFKLKSIDEINDRRRKVLKWRKFEKLTEKLVKMKMYDLRLFSDYDPKSHFKARPIYNKQFGS